MNNDAVKLANVISTYEQTKSVLQKQLDTLKQLRKSDGVFSIYQFKTFMEKNVDDWKDIDINRTIRTLTQQVRFNEALKITIDYTSLYNQKLQELENLEKSYTQSLNSIIPTAIPTVNTPIKHSEKKCSFWDWLTS